MSSPVFLSKEKKGRGRAWGGTIPGGASGNVFDEKGP
jgi:lipoprotein signal peptidase